jgi:hypothetical protein
VGRAGCWQGWGLVTGQPGSIAQLAPGLPKAA